MRDGVDGEVGCRTLTMQQTVCTSSQCVTMTTRNKSRPIIIWIKKRCITSKYILLLIICLLTMPSEWKKLALEPSSIQCSSRMRLIAWSIFFIDVSRLSVRKEWRVILAFIQLVIIRLTANECNESNRSKMKTKKWTQPPLFR